MRDPKRIYVVTGKLAELWAHVPDYRFWQVIQALKIPEELAKRDPFFWEDDVWLEIIQSNIDRFLR